MSLFQKNAGLYTDFYELTMAQGYYSTEKHSIPCTFDYFFRQIPFHGGYVLFSGIRPLLDVIKDIKFTSEDLEYLKDQGFKKDFLDNLAELKFTGNIISMREGEVVFPYEPVIRVESTIIEAQIIETLLLNIVNFESLIATKASRIRKAAGDCTVIDFGLRRAQALAGISASRAAIIGGTDATSNVYSAKEYDIKPSGTQAHSWIESFESEIESFRAFANEFPDNSILLVDTYDTLKSGIPNAIIIAHELEEKGCQLKGIRLDSGDLAYLSKKARKMLDEAGLNYVKIFASNQLDEFIIKSLHEQGAPIDGYGVGTKLVTGGDDPALDGVYKLTSLNGEPKLKISESIEKTLLPGTKKVYRCHDDNKFMADAICMNSETGVDTMYHPHHPEKSTDLSSFEKEEILHLVMENGKPLLEDRNPYEIAEFSRSRLEQLPEEHKRFENPHIYRVGISRQLFDLRDELIQTVKSKYKVPL